MIEQEALECHARAQDLQSQGRHAAALTELERAAQYFADTEGDASPDLANILADLAETLSGLCRYREAEEKARQAKEIIEKIRRLLDPDTRGMLVPRVYAMWGRSLRELGRYEEAAAALAEAIRDCDQSFGDNHPAIVGFLNEYGVLCKYWGRFDEGELHYLRALEIVANEFGPNSLEAATLYHNLGGLEHARGDYAKGEPLGRKAYEIHRRALGDDDPATVADAVAWAGLLDGLRRYEQSVPIYRRALAYYEHRFGPDHFEVAATLNNLAMARAAQGGIAEARELLERCLAIKRRLFDETHPEVRLTQANLNSLAS